MDRAGGYTCWRLFCSLFMKLLDYQQEKAMFKLLVSTITTERTDMYIFTVIWISIFISMSSMAIVMRNTLLVMVAIPMIPISGIFIILCFHLLSGDLSSKR